MPNKITQTDPVSPIPPSFVPQSGQLGEKQKGKQIAVPDALTIRDNNSPIDKVIDVLKPAAPDKPADLDFRMDGPVWVLSLSNDQTNELVRLLTGPGGSTGVAAWLASHGVVIAASAFPVLGQVALACGAAISYIEFVNKLFGNNGVDINGVVGTLGVVVTPRVGKVYNDLIQAARLAVSGRTILEFIVAASSQIPALAQALQIPVVATIFATVASGTPLGWAIAGAIGLAVNLLEPAPDPNAHGAVMADRDQAQAWESFYLGQLGSGNRVALLSWQGFFSAQGGGGQGVYANRPAVGDWETWTMIDNNDGTVSFQTINGHFLCAEEGGGRECQANRTSIGNWEKFFLSNLADGRVALKTHDKSKFVSVQP